MVMVAPPEIPRNAQQGKVKAALSNRGGVEQRGKQHTHYNGRDALKHNSEPAHLGSRAWLIGGGAMQEFSEVRTVASRNSLYHFLALNGAWGVWQEAKCGSTPSRLV
jgi:hypothetical protein